MCKDKIKQALENIANRPNLPNPERDADWKNCMKWSSHEAQEALTALDALHTYDPATHVVVPREPTDDVLNAMLQPLELGNAHDVYEAMISAAEGDK